MCGPYINETALKQQWEQQTQAIKGYHIHIYHDDPLHDYNAFEMTAQLQSLFAKHIKGVYNVGKVGPHNGPNTELEITREGFAEMLPWLQMNNKGLSILVHPETGDVVRDHLHNALWINSEKGLNEDFFAKIKPEPKPFNPTIFRP